MQAGTNSEMKVSTRLALGFGALVVLMVIIGGSAWLAMNSITHRLNEVIEDKVPKLEWIASINYNVICQVRKKPSRLTLNVKGDGYLIHETVRLLY